MPRPPLSAIVARVTAGFTPLVPALLLSLAGCAADQGQASADDAAGATTPPAAPTAPTAQREALASLVTDVAGLRIEHAAWRELGYRWDWTTTPSLNRRATVAHVAPLDDLLVIMDSTTRITMIEADTGRARWSANTGSPLINFVGFRRINDALAAFSRTDLYVLDVSNGGLLARQPLDVAVGTDAAVLGSIAIFGTPTGRLLAHEIVDVNGRFFTPPLDRGLTKWQYQLGGAVVGAPVLLQSTVAAVSQAGDVFFADARTGASINRVSIAGGVAANPVAGNGILYVASLDQSVYAFSPLQPLPLWRYRSAAPIREQAVLHDDTLFVPIPGEGLVALDAYTGSVKWRCPTAVGPVVAVRSGLLVTFAPGKAQAIDPARGDVRAEVALPGIVRLTTQQLVDQPLFALDQRGVVARFLPR